MDNLDTKSPTPSGTDDLQAQCDALRHLVVSMLILVVVISGTLNIYLLRQWRSTSKDLTAIRPQAAQMVADYQGKSGPMMNDFIKKLTEYGRTHADFAPILAKYNLKPALPTNPAPSVPAASAPKK
jgi:hypothetical protein